MKKTIISVLAVLTLTLGSAASALAAHGHGGGHGGGHFDVDFTVGPGWGPWWGPYPYSYPYYSTPVVVEREPELYVEPQQAQQYWYFCNNPKGYYPYVKGCPEGWMKVVPTPTAPSPDQEE